VTNATVGLPRLILNPSPVAVLVIYKFELYPELVGGLLVEVLDNEAENALSSDSDDRVYSVGEWATLYLCLLTTTPLLKKPSGGGVFLYFLDDETGGVSNLVGAINGFD
jgi:hypothetical protein